MQRFARAYAYASQRDLDRYSGCFGHSAVAHVPAALHVIRYPFELGGGIEGVESLQLDPFSSFPSQDIHTVCKYCAMDEVVGAAAGEGVRDRQCTEIQTSDENSRKSMDISSLTMACIGFAASTTADILLSDPSFLLPFSSLSPSMLSVT